VRQFLHILTSLGIRPWDNRGKCKCYMDGKRIQCLSNATHRSMYPSIFNRFPVIQPVSSKFTQTSKFSSTYLQPLRAILVGNWNFFLPPLHLTPPLGCSQFPLEFRGKFIPEKTRIMGPPGSEDAVCSLSRFDTIPACDGQTDRRTDRCPAYSYNLTRAVWLTHVKNSLLPTHRTALRTPSNGFLSVFHHPF